MVQRAPYPFNTFDMLWNFLGSVVFISPQNGLSTIIGPSIRSLRFKISCFCTKFFRISIEKKNYFLANARMQRTFFFVIIIFRCPLKGSATNLSATNQAMAKFWLWMRIVLFAQHKGEIYVYVRGCLIKNRNVTMLRCS